MELTLEDIRELLEALNVAVYDASFVSSRSNDVEELAAYKEHREVLLKWIRRLQTDAHPEKKRR